ncbi:hypothetical protein [Methylobacterium sp. WSM2598]|uniref:hypothetical protein n=1 Tax=Methylobacterium sp. WSM2598 TaxID=398261 RepID=UPI00038296EA|nr:hypothetical protein [Methylobacterium sp. WSM2598]
MNQPDNRRAPGGVRLAARGIPGARPRGPVPHRAVAAQRLRVDLPDTTHVVAILLAVGALTALFYALAVQMRLAM